MIIAVVIGEPEGEKLSITRSETTRLGPGTNNLAELSAVLQALKVGGDLSAVYTDSMYAAQGISGEWTLKDPDHLTIAEAAREIAAEKSIEVVYVPRGYNPAHDLIRAEITKIKEQQVPAFLRGNKDGQARARELAEAAAEEAAQRRAQT
jgi:ribonuclease HI